MNPTPGHRVLTWRWLLIAAAAGLLVLSLAQAIIRGDREALALVVVIVVGLLLLPLRSLSSVCCWASRLPIRRPPRPSAEGQW